MPRIAEHEHSASLQRVDKNAQIWSIVSSEEESLYQIWWSLILNFFKGRCSYPMWVCPCQYYQKNIWNDSSFQEQRKTIITWYWEKHSQLCHWIYSVKMFFFAETKKKKLFYRDTIFHCWWRSWQLLMKAACVSKYQYPWAISHTNIVLNLDLSIIDKCTYMYITLSLITDLLHRK